MEELKQENEMSSYNEDIVSLDEMEEVEIVGNEVYNSELVDDLDYVHKNRLPGAIVSTALVAGPLGIAGIIYAAKANMAYRHGQIADARFLNRKAKMWIRFGLWLGIACIVTFFILYIAFIVAMIGDAGLF